MYHELKEFGLSENEITVYVALIKAGNVSANRISKVTGMKRSTTYDNLNLLINKGLVSTIMKDGVNYYAAADPNKVIRLLDEKIDKIKKIVPELLALKESAGERTGVTFFEGKKGVITVLNDILDEGKELWFYGSRKVAMVSWKSYPDNFILKRTDLGINVKAILGEEDRGDPVYKNKKVFKLSKLRYSREMNQIPTNVFIYGDKVAFMTSGESLVGIIIKNKEVVRQQRILFDMLWKTAKK